MSQWNPPKLSSDSPTKHSKTHTPSLTSPDSNGGRGLSPRSPSINKTPKSGIDHKTANRLKQKITDQETKIKSLERDNQALNAKTRKYEETTNKKSKAMDKEKELRLKANQDKYWLQEKLQKMQMAIQARLKLLNIDFANCGSLSEALDAAFAAIQKLSAQLELKDQELQAMTAEKTAIQQKNEDFENQMTKLKKKMTKQNEVINDQGKQINDKQRRLSALGNKTDQYAVDQAKYENEMQKLRQELKNSQTKSTNQFNEYAEKQQKLMDDLANAKSENEKLLNQIDSQNNANQKMTNENDQLQQTLADLQNDFAQAKADAQREREEASKRDNENANKISELENELKSQKEINESLEERIKKLQKQLRDMEDTMSIQDEEIAKYKGDFESQKAAHDKLQIKSNENSKELESSLSKAAQEKATLLELSKKLKEQLNQKEDELTKLKQLYNNSKNKLDEIINKPTFDKAIQTDISSDWWTKNDMTIGRINDLEILNKELTEIAKKHEDRLTGVVDENKQLLDEIDFLIKQAAMFRPDGSNHTGQVVSFESSPGSYICATSASDRTVRLWRIDPKANKPSQCVIPYASARIEGTALSLAFSSDGKYLAAGVAYKNGPDGALLIWNLEKGEGEVETLFRSRETLRFGRAHCVCWDDTNQYIFTGDTTGTIWVWDLINMVQLASINAHKDVVHDVSVSKGMLFSCSLDQTLCGFDLKLCSTVKIKQDKLHPHQPKALKNFFLDKNERYPYQCVMPSEDLSYVIAGARKMFCFKFDEMKQNIEKGPRMTDTDADFVKSVKVKNGLVCICRQNIPRAKIYDVASGKELTKIQYKQPCSFVDFVWDMVHCVVVCQTTQDKKAKPPSLKLWKFK